MKKKKFFSQGFLPKIKKLLGGEKEKMNHILRRIVGRARAKEKGKGKEKEEAMVEIEKRQLQT